VITLTHPWQTRGVLWSPRWRRQSEPLPMALVSTKDRSRRRGRRPLRTRTGCRATRAAWAPTTGATQRESVHAIRLGYPRLRRAFRGRQKQQFVVKLTKRARGPRTSPAVFSPDDAEPWFCRPSSLLADCSPAAVMMATRTAASTMVLRTKARSSLPHAGRPAVELPSLSTPTPRVGRRRLQCCAPQLLAGRSAIGIDPAKCRALRPQGLETASCSRRSRRWVLL